MSLKTSIGVPSEVRSMGNLHLDRPIISVSSRDRRRVCFVLATRIMGWSIRFAGEGVCWSLRLLMKGSRAGFGEWAGRIYMFLATCPSGSTHD